MPLSGLHSGDDTKLPFQGHGPNIPEGWRAALRRTLSGRRGCAETSRSSDERNRW
jgi:hypothetical protein